MADYEHLQSKIGYNGFKQNAFVTGKTIKCKAKPKNLNTYELKKELERFRKGERRTKPTKLDGGGNFTDYTPARLERDKKENLNMLVSGFIDGKLIYIIEFPFNCTTFINRLEKQIGKWQEKLKGSKTIKGQFLRSATFNYKHFIKCPHLKIVFLLKKRIIQI